MGAIETVLGPQGEVGKRAGSVRRYWRDGEGGGEGVGWPPTTERRCLALMLSRPAAHVPLAAGAAPRGPLSCSRCQGPASATGASRLFTMAAVHYIATLLAGVSTAIYRSEKTAVIVVHVL